MDVGTTPDLQVALQLSAQMAEAAQAADWERVAGLQLACTGQLRHPWPATADNRAALRTLKEQHQSVMALGAAARERVGQELHLLRRSQQALNVYLDTGGPG